MKSVNKQYLLGFLLIILFGVGLVIGGVIHNKCRGDMIETQGYVVSVYTRIGDDGVEYRPSAVRFFVDGTAYETSVFSWYSYPLHAGDTMSVWYKKGDPNHTVVSNVSIDTMTYALIGIGGILTVAGLVLTVKYLYDVKRRKKV